MTETNAEPILLEDIDQGPDRIAQAMRWAVMFLVVCIVSVAGYAVVAGVFQPPAPRTQAEALLGEAQMGVKLDPGNGAAWAQLARAQFLTGDFDGAKDTIAKAKKSVKDDSILWVYNQEVEMLIRQGKNEQALKKTTDYIQKDVDFRAKLAAEEAARGISTPIDAQDNASTIEIFLLRAQAETNLKKYEDAVVSYSNALKMSPMAADILTLRGWANLGAKDKKAAQKDFEEALKYLPDDPSATKGLEACKAK